MDESWNLDRKPTAVERGVGIAAALILFSAGLLATWFSIVALRSVTAAIVAGAFAALFAVVLYRFVFSEGRRPQRSAILKMAAVFTVVGTASLIGSFFVDGLQEKVRMLFVGVAGIGGGAFNFARAKKTPNQPSQPTPGSDT